MLLDILTHLGLIRRLAANEFRGRYSGSALGTLWAVVQPLTMIVMYTLIFAVVLKVKVGVKGSVTDFGLFLICGMLAFNSVADSVRKSATVYYDQAHLMRRIPMPPAVLPASRVLMTFFEQGIALVLFIALLFVTGRPPGALFPLFVLLVPIQAAFAVSLSTAVSCLTVILKDIGALTESILTIWFLATPVFYPRDLVPEVLRDILDANPMTPLVEAYRSLILYNRLPDLMDLLYVSIVTGFALLLGHWVYSQVKDVIVDHV
jgi:lipopolysaccharide transport system permease protein